MNTTTTKNGFSRELRAHRVLRGIVRKGCDASWQHLA